MAAEAYQIGWIGLGSMGLAMAKNLQRHLASSNHEQYPLRYYNRTISRGATLQQLGGIPCDSVSDLLGVVDIVFVSMSDDAAVKSLVIKMLESSNTRVKVVVDTTTVHPDTTNAVRESLKAINASLVAAPAFGPSSVAEDGDLLFAIAGPTKATHMVLPYMRGVLGRAVMELGEDVKRATMLKAAGNFIVAGIMEVVAEAQVFAEKTQLGTDCLEKLIELNFGPETYAASRRMTTGCYAPTKGTKPQSDVALAIKDVQHGVSCAEMAGTRLAVANLTLEHLKKARDYSVKHGDRPLDSSSVFGIVRQEAGLDFDTDVVKGRTGSSSLQ